MQKLKMRTPDFTDENIARIAELFPNCVTESRDESGVLKRAIDFDQLKQELFGSIVDGPVERYQLDWPGKREALLTANAPIAKTLRPRRDQSVDFDTTKNLFIEGDNLDALKLLQETYLGKVKMIYMDPPYNTGNDFVFQDNFAEDKDKYFHRSMQVDEEGNRLVANPDSNGRFHSDWLSMMYSRLKLARNLLSDDGIAVISIDENEHANIVKLGELVFGDQNFCGEIVWKNSSKNDQSYVSIQHEYFVVFVKDKQINKGEWLESKTGLTEIYQAFDGFRNKYGTNWSAIHDAALEWFNQFPPSNPIVDSKHYSWMDERGVYFPADISGPNDGQYVYDVIHPKTKEVCKPPASGWRYPQTTMLERIRDKRIHFGADHTTVPNNKVYLKDTEYQNLTSMKFVDGRAASKRLKTLFGEKVFTNPKDEYLLKDFFRAMGVKDDDIVLDFFAGSATTIEAVMRLNVEQGSRCRSILAQWPEDLNEAFKRAKGSTKKVTKNAIDYLNRKNLPQNVSELSKERIRLSGSKIRNEVGLNLLNLDIGFRVLKIDTSNMKDVYYSPDEQAQANLLDQIGNVKEDRTAEDLLFQVLLDWGVDLALPIMRETIQGKEVFSVDENALEACFDVGLNEDFVKELAKRKPLRAVFRDAGFASDDVKINVEQIFKLLSPETEVRSI